MREMGAMCQTLLSKFEIKKYFMPYLDACIALAGNRFQDQATIRKNQILRLFDATEEDWLNWRWQFRNRIDDSRILEQVLGLSDLERKRIEKVGRIYRWGITPYYLSLIDKNYAESAIYRQSVPDGEELTSEACQPPAISGQTSPAPCVTMKYPNLAVLRVTNQCATLCRHCSRKRRVTQLDKHAPAWEITKALNYIRRNKDIREVIIGGGDALLLNDQALDWILHQLHCMPHIEIKRIKTRVSVTLPQRITPELCEILHRYAPVYINTQFNHPRELTLEARQACENLLAAEVILVNQAILLNGVNNNIQTIKRLSQILQQVKVRLNYILQPRNAKGTRHFQTTLEEARNIVDGIKSSGRINPILIKDHVPEHGTAKYQPGMDM